LVAKIDQRVLTIQRKLQGQKTLIEFHNMYTRVLGLPTLIHGEVFSSWVIRMFNSGLIKKKYLKQVLGYQSALYLDDIQPELFDLDTLTMKFNVGTSKLLPSAFIQPSKIFTHAKILSLTMNIFNGSPIYRCCPECLLEDEVPYIRKNWRYAFFYVCEKHGCLLSEKCNSCGCYINAKDYERYKKNLTENTIWRHCANCKNVFNHNQKVQIDERIVDALVNAQNNLEERLENNQDLERYLMQISYPLRYGFNKLYVGVSGSNLFGENTGKIQAIFSRNDLYKTTYWHSSNTLYLAKSRLHFRKAESLINSFKNL